jgi:mRNA interferase RelE/StbE
LTVTSADQAVGELRVRVPPGKQRFFDRPPSSNSGWNASLARCLRFGYNLARMLFAIVLAPEAVEDLKRLKAAARTAVKVALETHLRHEPQKTSRSRIKRLRGLSRPQYRLRVEDIRVFYDVEDGVVQVLAIVPKSETTSWLAQFGKP